MFIKIEETPNPETLKFLPGEVFFKGYVRSFDAEIQSEQEAAELIELVNNLSRLEFPILDFLWVQNL